MTKMKPETYALLQRHVAKFIPLERKAKQFEERKAIWNALWEANKEGLSLKAVYEDWSLMDDHVHTALCRLAREVRAAKRVDYVVIQDDDEGGSPLKRRGWKKGERYVVLEMCAYRGNEMVRSIGDIDFLKDGGDWVRGTFYCVSEIPTYCDHLRQLARDMDLPHWPNKGARS